MQARWTLLEGLSCSYTVQKLQEVASYKISGRNSYSKIIYVAETYARQYSSQLKAT